LVEISFARGDTVFAKYFELFHSAVFIQVLYRTIGVSAMTTFLCFLIGYPLARCVMTAGPKERALLLAVILLPFWINLLVRAYGWMIVLNPKGVINDLLIGLGIIHAPLALVYNLIGALIGMVQIMIPYMVLPIVAVMSRIDPQIQNAARSLGAGPIAAFVFVYFPMTLPGVMAGVLLVFTLSLGFFVIPAILGGNAGLMLAQLIEFNVNTSLDWGLASAMSTVLLIVTCAIYAISHRWFGLSALWATVR
jgi:putative spermidine/putrescine transport system permease protein